MQLDRICSVLKRNNIDSQGCSICHDEDSIVPQTIQYTNPVFCLPSFENAFILGQMLTSEKF